MKFVSFATSIVIVCCVLADSSLSFQKSIAGESINSTTDSLNTTELLLTTSPVPSDIRMTNSNGGSWKLIAQADWGGFKSAGCIGSDILCSNIIGFPHAEIIVTDTDFFPASKVQCCFESAPAGVDVGSIDFNDLGSDSNYKKYEFLFRPHMSGECGNWPDPPGCNGPSLVSESKVTAWVYNDIIWKVGSIDPNYTGTLNIEIKASITGEPIISDGLDIVTSYGQYHYEFAYNEPPQTEDIPNPCPSFGASDLLTVAKFSSSNHLIHYVKEDNRIRFDEFDGFPFWQFPPNHNTWVPITGPNGICQDTEFSLGIKFALKGNGCFKTETSPRVVLSIRISETGIACQ